ncbi:ribosome recycling factor [Prevotella dentalis DSM 3688]|uniref:Ribosome-recycling factor n=3 Tax=Prevotellaceae TaxID=171552 RepID=F9D0S0_PREDD|nr:ribosome recycling factor [Prevotella dentalis DSM 3688]
MYTVNLTKEKDMIDVKKTLKDAEDKMRKASDYLEEELARIRAGRANVAILDGVRVNAYGQMVPLNQVANLAVPDARTITIRPWDRKQIRDIEKGIMDSEVGVTPENNGEMVILHLPQPTEERRKELVKQCNKTGEATKVQVRNIRADFKDKLKKAVKDGLSEDLEKDAEADLQKLHDKYIKEIDGILANKQKEIMTV